MPAREEGESAVCCSRWQRGQRARQGGARVRRRHSARLGRWEAGQVNARNSGTVLPSCVCLTPCRGGGEGQARPLAAHAGQVVVRWGGGVAGCCAHVDARDVVALDMRVYWRGSVGGKTPSRLQRRRICKSGEMQANVDVGEACRRVTFVRDVNIRAR